MKVMGMEINRSLIRTYSLGNEGVSIQLDDGEWMHWKLSPAKAREVIDKIDNQMWGKLSENQLKAEAIRKEEDEKRYKEFIQCLKQPKQTPEHVQRIIRNQQRKRRPVNRWWTRQWLGDRLEKALEAAKTS